MGWKKRWNLEGLSSGRVVQTEDKGKGGTRSPRKGCVWQRPNLYFQRQISGLKEHGSSPSQELRPILDSNALSGPSLAQVLSPIPML